MKESRHKKNWKETQLLWQEDYLDCASSQDEKCWFIKICFSDYAVTVFIDPEDEMGIFVNTSSSFDPIGTTENCNDFPGKLSEAKVLAEKELKSFLNLLKSDAEEASRVTYDANVFETTVFSSGNINVDVATCNEEMVADTEDLESSPSTSSFAEHREDHRPDDLESDIAITISTHIGQNMEDCDDDIYYSVEEMNDHLQGMFADLAESIETVISQVIFPGEIKEIDEFQEFLNSDPFGLWPDHVTDKQRFCNSSEWPFKFNEDDKKTVMRFWERLRDEMPSETCMRLMDRARKSHKEAEEIKFIGFVQCVRENKDVSSLLERIELASKKGNDPSPKEVLQLASWI